MYEKNVEKSFKLYDRDLLLNIKSLSKSFTLHNQNGIKISALEEFDLELRRGECLVLSGLSGSGKSSVLKLLYGSYRVTSGDIHIAHNGRYINLVDLEPFDMMDVRKHTIGYVSQFLDVIPRISCVDAVCEPLLNIGINQEEAECRAEEILLKLNLPKKLWSLPPSTFSGGEKQRVNIARGFIYDSPILLLDEPTASLDKENIEIVKSLIEDKLKKRTGIIGIFHDENLKKQLATRMMYL